MKKSLIALAVIAASGAAFAQSSVTMYGLVDVYAGSVKAPNAANVVIRQNVINGGGLNGSRFGLKGSEDLGGGLKANFLLESGFDPSTGVGGTNSVFNRNSWVGLSGGFGEVKLGKMWTPYDDVQGAGAAVFNGNIFTPAAYVWVSNGYQANPGNSIYYATPSFGGLTAAASYTFGENKTATASAGHVVSANVAYAAGPFTAAVSYQVEKANGAVTTEPKFLQFNTSYDLGVVKLLGAYGRTKEQFANVEKTNEYQLGLDFPLSSAFTLSGGYAWSKDDVTNAADTKRKGFGIGGLYAVSKRTNLYFGVNDSKLEIPGAADAKTRVIAGGVRHTF